MTSPSIELRRIRDLSLTEITPLVAESTAEGFRFVARLAREWEEGAVRFDASGDILLGGYEGHRLVAIGGLTRDPYGTEADIGRLRHVYVMPEMRRLGIGRRVVEALEAAAAGRFRALVLRTDTTAAARFYEAMGYVPVGGGTATHRRDLSATATRVRDSTGSP